MRRAGPCGSCSRFPLLDRAASRASLSEQQAIPVLCGCFLVFDVRLDDLEGIGEEVLDFDVLFHEVALVFVDQRNLVVAFRLARRDGFPDARLPPLVHDLDRLGLVHDDLEWIRRALDEALEHGLRVEGDLLLGLERDDAVDNVDLRSIFQGTTHLVHQVLHVDGHLAIDGRVVSFGIEGHRVIPWRDLLARDGYLDGVRVRVLERLGNLVDHVDGIHVRRCRAPAASMSASNVLSR